MANAASKQTLHAASKVPAAVTSKFKVCNTMFAHNKNFAANDIL